jgi:hypothetical protein
MSKKELVLLSKAVPSDEYVDDCRYAIITIDEDMARRLEMQRKIFQKVKEEDSSLWEMYFWGGSITWFSDLSDKDEGLREKLDNEEVIAATPEDREWVEDSAQRVECDQVVIREDGFCFTAILKHTSIYVLTPAIGFDRLKELL